MPEKTYAQAALGNHTNQGTASTQCKPTMAIGLKRLGRLHPRLTGHTCSYGVISWSFSLETLRKIFQTTARHETVYLLVPYAEKTFPDTHFCPGAAAVPGGTDLRSIPVDKLGAGLPEQTPPDNYRRRRGYDGPCVASHRTGTIKQPRTARHRGQ